MQWRRLDDPDVLSRNSFDEGTRENMPVEQSAAVCLSEEIMASSPSGMFVLMFRSGRVEARSIHKYHSSGITQCLKPWIVAYYHILQPRSASHACCYRN